VSKKGKEKRECPTEDELMAIFLTAKGTVCKECSLYSSDCPFHLQNPQAFICPADAHKLTMQILNRNSS
jgi:hypothetical protein